VPRQAKGAAAIPHNLPLQLTSFVGRERELLEVTKLLTEPPTGSRLLTLTGAGGCGKTRLAVQVAREVIEAYPDGVWLIELAPLSDRALVPQTAAIVLGVLDAPDHALTQALCSALATKRTLLLLDNCEHVVEAAAELAEALLRACPDVTILATSREVLGAAGETTWRVPSLQVPREVGDGSHTPPHRDVMTPTTELLSYSSVRLFVDRARAMQPAFAVTEANAAAVAEICHRLDGIPLAIELAAARLKVFTVEQIAAGLGDCFRLLTAGQRTAVPRQQTLRATVDWSYALLAEPERALLRRLSVFAGGWTLQAAETVAAGDGIESHAVLDLLTLLVDKSLVLAEEQGGTVRYRLLETIRQYAREKLDEAGETSSIGDRHLDYFLRLAEDADRGLRGPEQPLWLDRLEAEHDNLRAALQWSLTTESGEAALRLSGALAWFWWCRGYLQEGRRWLARALASVAERSAARTCALYGAAWLAHHVHDLAAAHELAAESLEIARDLADRAAEAWALHIMGRIAYFENDPARARACGERSLALAESLGDRGLIAWALHLLGLAAYIAADYPTAREYYTRSLAIRQELGYREGIGILNHLLGLVAFREGNAAEARQLWEQNLGIMRELGMRWQVSFVLAMFSGLAATQGQPARAVRLAGATAMLGESYQGRPIPLATALLEEGLAQARQELGDEAYAAAWEEGRAMSIEQSIAEALAVEVRTATSPSPAAKVPPSTVPAGLTAAEVQVLRLLAHGHTTREIADELVVAVSTVDRHLTHIYGKLGVRNRAAAAAFALQHGLA
jgi:non-specific serine/threonine protein kinase